MATLAAPAPRGDLRVYGLSAALVLVTLVLLPGVPAAGSTWALAALLAAAFFCTESLPVHFRVKDNGVAATFSEIPLVIGLALCSPLLLIAARVAGTTLA